MPIDTPLHVFRFHVESVEILRVRVRSCLRRGLEEFVDVFREYCAHGVYRLVARQPFRPETRQCIDHCGLAERDLVLDHNMDRRVKRQPRDSNAASTMVRLNKSDALALVHQEPTSPTMVPLLRRRFS